MSELGGSGGSGDAPLPAAEGASGAGDAPGDAAPTVEENAPPPAVEDAPPPEVEDAPPPEVEDAPPPAVDDSPPLVGGTRDPPQDGSAASLKTEAASDVEDVLPPVAGEVPDEANTDETGSPSSFEEPSELRQAYVNEVAALADREAALREG